MTSTQRKREIVRYLRKLRASYRLADTQGEKLERELDRLIKRKRVVEEKSLLRALDLYAQFLKTVQYIATGFQAIGDFYSLA